MESLKINEAIENLRDAVLVKNPMSPVYIPALDLIRPRNHERPNKMRKMQQDTVVEDQIKSSANGANETVPLEPVKIVESELRVLARSVNIPQLPKFRRTGPHQNFTWHSSKEDSGHNRKEYMAYVTEVFGGFNDLETLDRNEVYRQRSETQSLSKLHGWLAGWMQIVFADGWPGCVAAVAVAVY
ncbi:hypothetical protein HDU77_006542 [Chytriomyces hyalinus]|nr:hypothetical protein HDU77_006542 [Chytriomyces hyalinus]